jgi:hypothetical protein
LVTSLLACLRNAMKTLSLFLPVLGICVLGIASPGRAQGPIQAGPLLDLESQGWTTTPAGSFFEGGAAESFDGVDALLFSTPQGSPTSLTTTVTGPALVSWRWRRTDENSDLPGINLHFLYDGNRLADHDDGERWEKISIQIPAGPHTLEWRIPNFPFDNTQKAVLDQMTLTPDAILPETQAMNDPGGVWLRTELGTDWKVGLISHDGVSAAEARPALKNQATSLRRMVSGPAQLSWWWQLQGTDNNQLKAKLRAIFPSTTFLVTRWDLLTARPWQRATATVPSGLHVINWRYEYAADSANATATGAGAAGQVDEFTSAPLGLQEALGMPNQVWRFGGAWGIAALSADTVTPGSIIPPVLGAAGAPDDTAWLEGSFTGPMLISWRENVTGASFSRELSIDGTPAPEAMIDGQPYYTAWQRRLARIPAGLHTVRWSYRNSVNAPQQPSVLFDVPEVFPALLPDSQAALDVAGSHFFQPANSQSTVVSNAPNGPGGNSALQLAPGGGPLAVFGAPGQAAAPALVSYYYRRNSAALAVLRERGSVNGDTLLAAGPEWTKRSLMVARPSWLSWDVSASEGPVSIDRFSNDAPAVDVNAWLARSGLTWSVPAQDSLMARTWDEAVPAPSGDRLFLFAGNAPALWTRPATGGILRVVTQQPFAGGGSLQVLLEPVAAEPFLPVMRIVSVEGDSIMHQFAIPPGDQRIGLEASSDVMVKSISWTPSAGNVVAEFAREGLGGEGMDFTIDGVEGVVVRNVGFGNPGRRVLTLLPVFPGATLSSTVQGPGILTFDWQYEKSERKEADGGMFRVGNDSFPKLGYGWSRVRMALPPGPAQLRWSSSGIRSLNLDNFVWEPAAVPVPPAAGLLATATRPGNRMWWAQPPGSAPLLTSPWDLRPDSANEVSVTATGPGLFQCDARVLASSLLPHFNFKDGEANLTIRVDGVAVMRTIPSWEWRPLALPLTAGAHTISFAVENQHGYEGPNRSLPATLELRSAAVLPQETFAVMSEAGVAWIEGLSAGATGGIANTSRGLSRVWRVPGSLTGTVEGPGTLEWESTHDAGSLMIAVDAQEAVDWSGDSFFPPSLTSHQLVLPIGMHEITWGPATGAGLFGQAPLALGLAVRWVPSPHPPLALAAGLPLTGLYHFASDGGWLPEPFDPAEPRIRLRTRFAGPAFIHYRTLDRPIASPVWGVRDGYGDDVVDEEITALSFQTTGFFWSGPEGERGNLTAPYPVERIGKIISSAARTGETLAQWAARHGVAADPLTDADGDGLALMLESCLGLDPRLPEPGVGAFSYAQPATARFPWPANMPAGLSRIIEMSPDLIGWTPAPFTVTGEVAKATLVSPMRYVRVRAWQ